MSRELLPISCVSCRRRKIKCNKKKPCDQCIKRHLICEFPSTFRNIKILEKEFKIEEQDKSHLSPDGPAKLQDESTTTPSSMSGSILSLAQNQSSSEATEILPSTSDDNSKSPSSLSPDKINLSSNNETEIRSDSSSSALSNPLRLFSFDHSQQKPIRAKYDIQQYIKLQEKFEMMKAANSQLLSENRILKKRLKELLQKVDELISQSNNDEFQSNAGSKRDRDSSSEDLPSKRDRVGVFGHTKASFPEDSVSKNQGIYSKNVSQKEQGADIPVEDASSISSESDTTSAEDARTKIAREAQILPRDQRLQQSTRKQSRDMTNKHHHEHQHQHQNKRQSATNRMVNDWERDVASLQDQELLKSNILVENSFRKKKLPILPSYLLKYNDVNVSSDSETYADVYKLNFKVINKLVEGFFENSPYYRTFISSSQVMEFLKNYESISDRDWANDDDLLLVYMILCLSIQRLSPKEYADLNLLPDAAVNTCTKYRKYLTRHVIYKNFEKLRDNLVNESLQTIRAYILCVEWLFSDQKYEDCWSMMFHACSVSYSIGLHIMSQYKFHDAILTNITEDADGSENKWLEILEGNEKEKGEKIDVARYRLWFALKYYTSLICAIFGRPNPISVQVGMNSNDPAGLKVANKKLSILLKIGSAELLRLSNLMLIENYMINFTFDDLMQLAAKFTEEIKLLESAYKCLDDTDETALELSSSPSDRETSRNSMNRLNYPCIPTLLDVLSDIIILWINKSKLFEPFIKKFENQKNYDTIVEFQINSITKFLELSNLFVESFLQKYLEMHIHRNSITGNTSSDEERNKTDQQIYPQHSTNYGPAKLGKLINSYYPFLNSLICQGIIVVFTLLHSKSKEFVDNDEATLLNNSFLKVVENSLNKFLSFESRMSTKFITTSRMWSSNMVYLINRVLNLIKLIHEKQEQRATPEQQQQQEDDFPITTSRGNLSYLLNPNPFGDPSQFEYLNGFHLNDPYWLAVPDDLPYYLGSQIEMDQFQVSSDKNQNKTRDSYQQE